MTRELEQKTVEELKAFACTLADAAAAVSLKYFKQPVAVENKDADKDGNSFDPVTLADRGAEEAIRALIEAQYPEHGIFGEEFGIKKTDSPFEWVLDPIDGTRAFISGIPSWGTLIALRYKGEPVIGVIDQPYVRERYLGWSLTTLEGEMRGATLNGVAISTRACGGLEKATLCTTDANLFTESERPLFDAVLGRARLTRYGLDCYAYAVLAAGHIDVVIESGLQPYDMMALIPVVRGAGGMATNWHGESAGTDGRLVAVGDKAVWDEALPILGRV